MHPDRLIHMRDAHLFSCAVPYWGFIGEACGIIPSLVGPGSMSSRVWGVLIQHVVVGLRRN